MDLIEIKDLIENNPVAFATVTEGNRPNVVIVDGVRVVSDNQVIITDNYMDQSIFDIQHNNCVCLVAWAKDLKRSKIIGKAEYFTEGKWKKFVKDMKENAGLPAKGAILITVEKIIPSA